MTNLNSIKKIFYMVLKEFQLSDSVKLLAEFFNEVLNQVNEK